MKLKQKAGFTLIEILVVVLIIAVLTAVAMPMYKRAVWKSRTTEVKIYADNLLKAQTVYRLGRGEYTQNLEELDIKL